MHQLYLQSSLWRYLQPILSATLKYQCVTTFLHPKYDDIISVAGGLATKICCSIRLNFNVGWGHGQLWESLIGLKFHNYYVLCTFSDFLSFLIINTYTYEEHLLMLMILLIQPCFLRIK